MKNIKITQKTLSIIVIGIFIISLIPMLYISRYNHPCADDFSYSYLTRNAWVETGSIFNTLGAAFEKVAERYEKWQGTYSSIFLMALQPSVFSEKLYFITPFIMIGMMSLSVILFFKTLLGKCLGANKYQITIISLTVLMIFMQLATSPVEAFYWYNGAVHYVFMNSIMLIMLSSVLEFLKASNKKREIIYIIIASVLGIILGVANYVTVLTSLICFGIVFIFNIYYKNKKSIYLLIPFLSTLIGFIISAAAPGNSVRQSQLEINSPLLAIKSSFEYGLSYADSWLTLAVVAVLIFLSPIIWKMVVNSNAKFRFPAIVVGMSFCLHSAMFTPMLYTTGTVGPARAHNIIQLTFYMLIVLDLIYILGWISNLLKKNGFENALEAVNLIYEKKSNYYFAAFLVTMLVIFAFTWFGYFTSESAVKLIVSGEAKQYHEEYMERLDTLNSDENKVTLNAYTVYPSLLFFDDIDMDSSNWKNKHMARFYNKKKVSLRE